MEHNLEDSLNMEIAMAVDFGHSEEVETEADIGLDSSGHEGIPMEFEHNEGQPLLMETGNEEIVVSDYIGGQEQYTILDIRGGETGGSAAEQIVPSQPQIQQKEMSAPTQLRQIAIAPKPQQSVLLQKAAKQIQVNKQYAIAPKPVTVMSANRTVSLVKKVSLAGAMQANAKGKPVLAQIGKQLVMMPASSGAQKLKLVTPTVRLIGSDQAKLITTGTGPKQLTKVIVQGNKVKSQAISDPSNQSAVLTKVVSGAGTTAPARYVTMHQKTVPISIGDNKILLTSSPMKQGATKQQVVSLNSPAKILPAQTTQGAALKKVVINANQMQNLVVKSQPKTVYKGAQQVQQKTQLHRIEVPGKGVQYIRLVTNSSPGATKPSTKVTTSAAGAQKTYVLADAKGNVYQMSGELSSTGQTQQSLVVSTAGNKVTSKQPPKLVRIAPVTSKAGQAFMQQARSGKSLLAPQPASAPQPSATSSHDMPDLADLSNDTLPYHEEPKQPVDSKTALHKLIADAVHDGPFSPSHEHPPNGSPRPHSPQSSHPLIVVPSFLKHEPDAYLTQEELQSMGGAGAIGSALNVEVELEPYTPRPSSPDHSDTELIQTHFGLRPRKACNCTKSQCLKLYCDCFANGEFCNRCNCHNCHNNLENEELRQKAIRGCLDRNPYAFRPKIGKTKAVGPEAVRRHNKGCNCKRSGCLKNYCECYEAKIACSSICKCVGCRNVEDSNVGGRRRDDGLGLGLGLRRAALTSRMPLAPLKQPCSFMTMEVIEAVCQCLVAAGVEGSGGGEAGEGAEASEPPAAPTPTPDPLRAVIEEFARCLQDIISAAHHAAPAPAPHPLLEARA